MPLKRPMSAFRLPLLAMVAGCPLWLPPAAGAGEAKPPPAVEVPAPPAMPEDYDSTDLPGELEPEVTIVPKEKEIHKEYRVNGRLYMIEVIPAKGPRYFLVDPDGSGKFVRSELGPDVVIPMWVIKRF